MRSLRDHRAAAGACLSLTTVRSSSLGAGSGEAARKLSAGEVGSDTAPLACAVAVPTPEVAREEPDTVSSEEEAERDMACPGGPAAVPDDDDASLSPSVRRREEDPGFSESARKSAMHVCRPGRHPEVTAERSTP